MTPFELWQAGGPEPVVMAELPSPWGPPWKGKRNTWRWHAVNYGLDVYKREKAEECRAALARWLHTAHDWPLPAVFP